MLVAYSVENVNSIFTKVGLNYLIYKRRQGSKVNRLPGDQTKNN